MRRFERALFASRWLLLPLYVGLALSLVAILAKSAQEAAGVVRHVLDGSGDALIIGVLSLVDLSLVANLVLIVVFAGYENFVSRLDLDQHPDKPSWMAHVGYGDIKLKLMTSIVAISAIHVLESFMNVESLSDRELGWAAGLHLLFIVSALLLAVMDRLASDGPHAPAANPDPIGTGSTTDPTS